MGFDALLSAAAEVASGGSFLYLLAGILLGLCFGVIPGLGGTTALALLIPVTFGMDKLDAMYLAGGVMGATSFGGSITAILLNTPGTAPNAATTFDGYPLARQGKGGLAIGAAACASAMGGVIGLFTLILFIPLAKEIVLSFGPAEFFLLTVLGLTAIAVSVRGKLLRGLIAGCLGLMLAFVGSDAITGDLRFTGGVNYLWDGIPLVPTLTGMFAISQMMELALKGGSVADKNGEVRAERIEISGVWDGVLSVFKNWTVLLRGSFIGTVIGAIPGLGGTVASFLAYSSVVQTAKDPETYGKGNIRGVIAPESANNAKDGGSLIPTVAFGIPGSAETALFLGILVLHGIDPGPSILLYHEREIYGLIVAITGAAVGASLIGLLLSRFLVLITRVDVGIVVPVVVAVSLTGVYVLDGRMADVLLTVVMGVIGYLMIRFDYPRLTLVIALVLGETAEKSFHQVQLISDGHALEFMMARPVSMLLIVATLLTFLLPIGRKMLEGARRRRATTGGL
ncbi:tricarboxylic transporter [Brevirhabdus pacifica]|uniref:Tricarboxylic transporter n=1 Tax=Brevirhabdus pacifica TaxID=1267768 RepID=A0A1U7DHN2_9RHOB|nr:tripartite tricarboxylate transporter permease [Brevirhabdus pacifica]APX89492.1 tricarboxylic transporter [Brevirhabdus pacifica]OWU76500.1 tricarboxylate transport membrane protein TctA [Loktanella sp. 22II-4b]PJJ85858.1 putative tricarboxylic transport membrane protein [Brevirhabdus pacifica]